MWQSNLTSKASQILPMFLFHELFVVMRLCITRMKGSGIPKPSEQELAISWWPWTNLKIVEEPKTAVDDGTVVFNINIQY